MQLNSIPEMMGMIRMHYRLIFRVECPRVGKGFGNLFWIRNDHITKTVVVELKSEHRMESYI